MRTIKFRGKRIDNDEWIYGDLYHANELTYICDWFSNPNIVESITIYPNTIGQFTGLTDISGVKIYEGDIINYVCDGSQNGIIIYDDFGCVIIDFGDNEYLQPIGSNLLKTIKIVGNIHDNRELLIEK